MRRERCFRYCSHTKGHTGEDKRGVKLRHIDYFCCLHVNLVDFAVQLRRPTNHYCVTPFQYAECLELVYISYILSASLVARATGWVVVLCPSGHLVGFCRKMVPGPGTRGWMLRQAPIEVAALFLCAVDLLNAFLCSLIAPKWMEGDAAACAVLRRSGIDSCPFEWASWCPCFCRLRLEMFVV